MVEHMGRSWIGGYGLCSLGLKYSLANDGFSLFSSCSSMFAIVEKVKLLLCFFMM